MLRNVMMPSLPHRQDFWSKTAHELLPWSLDPRLFSPMEPKVVRWWKGSFRLQNSFHGGVKLLWSSPELLRVSAFCRANQGFLRMTSEWYSKTYIHSTYSKKTAISNVAEAPSFQAASLGWWWRVWICLTGQLRNISPGIFTKLSHAQKVNHTKLVSFYVFSCCFAVYIKMQKFPAHHCCTKKIHLHCKKASSCCWTRRWYLHVVTGLFCIRFQYSIHRFSPWNEVLDGMCRRVRNDFSDVAIFPKALFISSVWNRWTIGSDLYDNPDTSSPILSIYHQFKYINDWWKKCHVFCPNDLSLTELFRPAELLRNGSGKKIQQLRGHKLAVPQRSWAVKVPRKPAVIYEQTSCIF